MQKSEQRQKCAPPKLVMLYLYKPKVYRPFDISNEVKSVPQHTNLHIHASDNRSRFMR